MPIAFNKDARTVIYLKADLDRPENERVGFLCRFITAREHERAYQLAEQAREEKDAEKSSALLLEALAVGLIGPKDAKTPDGAEVPCTIDGVWMVLSLPEIWDLLWEYPNAVSLSEVDLKKSMLPSSSNGGNPVVDNPPANAATAPPQPVDSARAA